MKNKLIAQLYRRKRNSYYLTAIVGGYLIYLAGKLLDELPEGSGALIAAWAAIVIFALCGALFIALSVWALAKGYCMENAPADDGAPPEEN